MAKPQWIICTQGYNFPDFKYVIKELCAMNFETIEFYNFHVKSGDLERKHVGLDKNGVGEYNMEMMLLDHEKYIKLNWNDGTINIGQLRSELESIIPKVDRIITPSPTIRIFLERCGYINARSILLPSIDTLDKCPATTCGQYDHDDGFMRCAQRLCFEYLRMLNADNMERYCKNLSWETSLGLKAFVDLRI
jgi:hypothetical protein